MTHYTRADLQLANRHVTEGERLVIEQERRITRLLLGGHTTDDAEELLVQLTNGLALHREHRDAIAAALNE